MTTSKFVGVPGTGMKEVKVCKWIRNWKAKIAESGIGMRQFKIP